MGEQIQATSCSMKITAKFDTGEKCVLDFAKLPASTLIGVMEFIKEHRLKPISLKEGHADE
mgnify:FL=1